MIEKNLESQQRFKKLLESLKIDLSFNKDQVIEINYLDVPISIYYNEGLIVFYCTFLLEYKPSAAFTNILLSTCNILEQPSVQVSKTDNEEITLWSREWLDKISDDSFFEWLERFCEVSVDWQHLLEEYNSRQELRESIRFARKNYINNI